LNGEGHGTREGLGEAARMNPPVYGDRHAATVMTGTRETLPRTTASARRVKWGAAGRESERVEVPVNPGQHNLEEESEIC
jgi:hypothetical protein